MGESRTAIRTLRRALRDAIFLLGVFIATSCGIQPSAAPSQTPLNAYEEPAARMRYQYYGWGQNWENYYVYTPKTYFIPSEYCGFYPPWVYLLSHTTYYMSAPGWINSVINFAQPPAYRGNPGWPGSVPSYSAVTSIFFSAGEGSHRVGAVACTTYGNYQSIGSLADCGGGSCSGDETACKSFITENPLAPDSNQVVIDAFVTAEGAHNADSFGCPPGYTIDGMAADCGNGNCSGNQLFCSLSVPVNSLQPGSTYVYDITLTTEGAHVITPVCPTGYTRSGIVADCGGDSCYGNQALCVKKNWLQ